jgi:putative membrane protein
MNRMLTAMASMAFLFGAVALRADEDTKPAQKPFDDAAFVKKAASGGLHEVALGKIAEAKGMTEGVKKLGAKLVADHTKANAELAKAATAAGLAVPEMMSEKHMKMVEKFAKYEGTDFDQAFLQHAIHDHKQDIADFKQASKEAKNPSIKAFAAMTLPVIEEHLHIAEKLAGKKE